MLKYFYGTLLGCNNAFRINLNTKDEFLKIKNKCLQQISEPIQKKKVYFAQLTSIFFNSGSCN